jgi:hypothetical protein
MLSRAAARRHRRRRTVAMTIDCITVEYPRGLPRDDVRLIVTALDQAGVAAEVRAAEAREGGVTVDPWQLLVIMSLSSFLTTFASETGREAAKALVAAQRLVRRRLHQPPAPTPAATPDLVVELRDRYLSLTFPADLLDDADWPLRRLGDLLAIRLDRGTSYRWDRTHHRWQPEGAASSANGGGDAKFAAERPGDLG